jgi:hypothetical protein
MGQGNPVLPGGVSKHRLIGTSDCPDSIHAYTKTTNIEVSVDSGLFRVKFFVIFLSPSREMAHCLELDHDHFLPHLT